MAKERAVITILALDQATAVTGWALYKSGILADYGKIKIPVNKKKTADERTDDMLAQIAGLIASFEPDEIIIEDVANQKNVATVVKLARIQGAIIEMRRCFITPSLRIVKPTEWRKGLKFRQGRVKRPELKAQAKAFATKQYGIEVSEDEADAICIGYFCANIKEE